MHSGTESNRLFRSALVFSTALMVLLSWPLWTGTAEFPRVPFLRWADAPAERLDIAASMIALSGLCVGATRRTWRVGCCIAVVSLAILVARDQNRLQPWAYQFLVLGTVLTLTDRRLGLTIARWYLIGLYTHSGLSKLDVSFGTELGARFLASLVGPFGVQPRSWPESLRLGVTLLMPAVELILGLGLVIRRTRRWASGGLVIMHLVLIGLLGPWALNHSAIVLVWNASLLLENLLLFQGYEPALTVGDESWTTRPTAILAVSLGALSIVLPFGERWGYFDAWPSHALYASHVGRVDILIAEVDRTRFPLAVQRHAGEPDASGWCRVDLTGWSRELRGVPVYPGVRAGLGIAEWLACRYPGQRPVKAVVYGPADRWTRWRRRNELVGLEAIRRFGRDFLVNAHPSPTVSGCP